MLAEIGIASVVASGSRDARELIEQHGGSISFVLAEVDGAHDCCGSLLRELRTDRPDVRIICLTADGTRLPEPLALLADNRLTKPFTAIGLSDAVSRARAA
jgi:DNA-binding NtrC family response regulator